MAHKQSVGLPFVLSAPSGTGKTTLAKHLLQQLSHVITSVSYTTRAPRPGEQHGIDYHFIGEDQFRQMIAEQALLEWAQVHGCLYGTGKALSQEVLHTGQDMLFVVDVQGGKQIQQQFPQAVLIFVVPPSMAELARRLTLRGSDSDSVRAKRLAAARQEMEAGLSYTYWLINDTLEEAAADLIGIVRAERLRQMDRQHLLQRLCASS